MDYPQATEQYVHTIDWLLLLIFLALPASLILATVFSHQMHQNMRNTQSHLFQKFL